jgi:hypothetical protein
METALVVIVNGTFVACLIGIAVTIVRDLFF